jgi:TRAP-type uncharacterized transport system substrate-binding protein
MANILSKYLPGMQATAEVTGGSVDNLKLLGAGKAEVAFAMVDAAWEATQGQDKFKDAKVNVRTLMALYPNRMQIVTVDGTGITKLAGLKGRRVSTGAPGSGVEVMALRVLEAIGIDARKDIKQNIDVWNVLVTNDRMSDQMAYDIVKTLMEKKPELVAVHKEAGNIDMKYQKIGSPIPYHPGARKYFEEHGVKF